MRAIDELIKEENLIIKRPGEGTGTVLAKNCIDKSNILTDHLKS